MFWHLTWHHDQGKYCCCWHFPYTFPAARSAALHSKIAFWPHSTPSIIITFFNPYLNSTTSLIRRTNSIDDSVCCQIGHHKTMVKPINRSAPIQATSTITSNHHRLLFAVVGLLSVVAVSSDIPVVVEDEQSAVEQETVLKGLYRFIFIFFHKIGFLECFQTRFISKRKVSDFPHSS